MGRQISVPSESLGSKQARDTLARIRGLAVLDWYLAEGLV